LDKRKNEQVAIKTIKKSRIENPHDLARIRREIDFMTSLNHPYIIRIKEGRNLNKKKIMNFIFINFLY
jgi:serine/threonine protein kinase